MPSPVHLAALRGRRAAAKGLKELIPVTVRPAEGDPWHTEAKIQGLAGVATGGPRVSPAAAFLVQIFETDPVITTDDTIYWGGKPHRVLRSRGLLSDESGARYGYRLECA